jgi:hypothetical protein
MSTNNMEIPRRDSRLRRLTRHAGNDEHARQEIAAYTLCDVWRHGAPSRSTVVLEVKLSQDPKIPRLESVTFKSQWVLSTECLEYQTLPPPQYLPSSDCVYNGERKTHTGRRPEHVEQDPETTRHPPIYPFFLFQQLTAPSARALARAPIPRCLRLRQGPLEV